MFEEHDQIVLTVDVTGDDGQELKPGDVGVVVHVHPGGEAFVAEFTALDGNTDTIATVLPAQARPITGADPTQVRIGDTDIDDVLDAIRERKAASGGRVPPSSIIEARDADRR